MILPVPSLVPSAVLQDQFVFAVAVQVSQGGVARPIVGDRLDGDLEVVCVPGPHACRGRQLTALPHGAHEVLEGTARAGVAIEVIGRVDQRPVIDLDRRGALPAAVEIEPEVGGIGAEEPPTHVHAAIALVNRHQAAAEVFHLALSQDGQSAPGEHQRQAADPNANCLHGAPASQLAELQASLVSAGSQ